MPEPVHSISGYGRFLSVLSFLVLCKDSDFFLFYALSFFVCLCLSDWVPLRVCEMFDRVLSLSGYGHFWISLHPPPSSSFLRSSPALSALADWVPLRVCEMLEPVLSISGYGRFSLSRLIFPFFVGFLLSCSFSLHLSSPPPLLTDWVPLRVCEMLEPVLSVSGYGHFSLRHSPSCAFLTCLASSSLAPSLPLPRVVDVGSFYRRMLPLLRLWQQLQSQIRTPPSSSCSSSSSSSSSSSRIEQAQVKVNEGGREAAQAQCVGLELTMLATAQKVNKEDGPEAGREEKNEMVVWMISLNFSPCCLFSFSFFSGLFLFSFSCLFPHRLVRHFNHMFVLSSPRVFRSMISCRL